MYEFVRERGSLVSRDEVAASHNLSRRAAAFHLDTLVGDGLLVATYARVSGRAGPGAGRSSKLYEPSDLLIDVSIPKRRYDLAGSVLLEAIETRPTGRRAIIEQAGRIARARGAEWAEQMTMNAPPRGKDVRSSGAARAALVDIGYEPRESADQEIVFTNCPFHAFSERFPDLTCSMNHAFVRGVLERLGDDPARAVSDRAPGRCCVVLRPPSGRG